MQEGEGDDVELLVVPHVRLPHLLEEHVAYAPHAGHVHLRRIRPLVPASSELLVIIYSTHSAISLKGFRPDFNSLRLY